MKNNLIIRAYLIYLVHMPSCAFKDKTRRNLAFQISKQTECSSHFCSINKSFFNFGDTVQETGLKKKKSKNHSALSKMYAQRNWFRALT